MNLSKEDKKLRLVLEVIGILTVLAMLMVLIIFKGGNTSNSEVPNNNEVVTDVNSGDAAPSQSTDSIIVDTSLENQTNNNENSSNSNVNTNISIGGEGIVVENNENPGNTEPSNEIYYAKNNEVGEADPTSYEMITSFLSTAQLNDYFRPEFSTIKQLYLDESNILNYRYIYNAIDGQNHGTYANLNMRATYGVNSKKPDNLYISINVTNDLQAQSTARANLAIALSKLYNNEDLNILATANNIIEFNRDNNVYRASASTGLDGYTNYEILYFTVDKISDSKNYYDNNKASINTNMDFKDLIKNIEITSIDNTSLLGKLSETFNISKDIKVSGANITNTYNKTVKEIQYTYGDNNKLIISNSMNKDNKEISYSIKLTDTNKNKDDLKNLSTTIAKELFNVNLGNIEFKEDTKNKLEYYTSSRLNIRVFGNTLEIVSANSEFDFMNYLFETLEEPKDIRNVQNDDGTFSLNEDISGWELETEPYGEDYQQSLSNKEDK